MLTVTEQQFSSANSMKEICPHVFFYISEAAQARKGAKLLLKEIKNFSLMEQLGCTKMKS